MRVVTAGFSLVLSVVALASFGPPQAAPEFEPVQPELFAAGRTLVNAWADFDGDGKLDLFVGFNGAPNRLYRYAGGRFADVAASAGLAEARATRAAAWGDFDGDGDLDLLVGFAPGPTSVLTLYRNDGGVFGDVTAGARLAVSTGAVRQLSWIDFDGDGDLDLFVAFRDRANMLFLNDGGGFRDVAAERGVADPHKSVGAVWFDADEDSDLDLVVANMDGHPNTFFRNDGGVFVERADSAHIAWGGRAPRDSTNGSVRVCAADVNGDGRLDLFFANYGRNGLFLNRGAGTFEDVSHAWGVDIDSRYDTCALEDFDNDGKIDLYVNGTVTGGTNYRDYLFRNTGTAFVDVTPPNLLALKADHGAQWADFDGDGAMDLALTGSGADGMHLLFRNMLPAAAAARSLSVRVVSTDGRMNCAGAEVRVYSRGTRTLLGTRLVDTGSGYDAQNAMPVHFGLPAMDAVDVEVAFPAGDSRPLVRVERVNPATYHGRDFIVRIARPR